MQMKVIVSCVLLVLLAGCNLNPFRSEDRLYEVRLMSGDTLYAKREPRVDADGYYRFSDVNDQTYVIRKNLVLFIEPASIRR